LSVNQITGHQGKVVVDHSVYIDGDKLYQLRPFNCLLFIYLVSSVPVIASASVAISTIHFTVAVAKSLVCITKLVQSYCSKATPLALITPVCGSLPSRVFIFTAHSQLIFTLQAPVFVVVNLHGRSIPVV
jgi:hypothetical protein